MPFYFLSKYVSALIVAFTSGCKASGFRQKKYPSSSARIPSELAEFTEYAAL
jgi:hypothetical protein